VIPRNPLEKKGKTPKKRRFKREKEEEGNHKKKRTPRERASSSERKCPRMGKSQHPNLGEKSFRREKNSLYGGGGGTRGVRREGEEGSGDRRGQKGNR